MMTRRLLAKCLPFLCAAPVIANPAMKLASGAEILKSFDARDWARYFVEHVRAKPTIATDVETMETWFANALMRGFDEHAYRQYVMPNGEVRAEVPQIA